MTYKILEKIGLDAQHTLYEMVLDTPLIAKKARAGNFILIRIKETGERFPLTIADYDRDKGTITIVFQVVGKSTDLLASLEIGDDLLDVIGPLGNAIEIEKYPHPIILIGGGVGIAPCYPQAKELKEAGNYIITIIGARTSELLFWKEKMEQVSDELIICTDDGSEGTKGVVTKPLKEIISNKEVSIVIAIGPLIMMKFVALTTKGDGDLPYVKTFVSLNTIMVDGTGMCGGCRFSTPDGKVFFACVDGPDVDGHMVDFDNLLNRAKRYSKFERQCHDKYKNECRALKHKNSQTS